MSIPGLDVSHHNGAVSWSRVRAAGCRFVLLKATEGTGYTDPTYGHHRAAARAAGLYVGAYHFASPEADPHAQARHFAATIGPLVKGDLPPCLDLETTGGHGPAQLNDWALAFLATLASLRRERSPLVYFYPDFRVHALGGGQRLTSRYRLWWARYEDHLPSGDPAPLIWQHTSTGQVDGIAGHVDLDTFLGTAAQLDQLAGVTATTAPPSKPASAPPAPARPVNTKSDQVIPVQLVNLRHAHETIVTGPGVKSLQALLILAGELRGPVDGRAGLGTRTALCRFQAKAKLPVDAIVGADTWAALDSI